ncbi:MAG: nucleotidyltransferase family protein [Bacillota bacterium]
MQAVLLAGGRGTRLLPYTKILPKPLFSVGGQALAKTLVMQLKNAGVDEIVICLGYLSELITAFFGDGTEYGLKIRYSCESIPLGTAGPLTNVTGLAENFLVVNADEFTNLDFSDLFACHQSEGAAMTIAVQKKPVKLKLGVVDIQKNGQVYGYAEKPTINFWVSMGMYVLNRRVVDMIPRQVKIDIPDLVKSLLDRQEKIVSYVSDDLWIDIGTLEDLRKAREIASSLSLEQLRLK